MKWTSSAANDRDFALGWKLLRERDYVLANLTNQFTGWFPDVVWTDMPSNQFASAEEMRAAGWAMDQRRDEHGRLAI